MTKLKKYSKFWREKKTQKTKNCDKTKQKIKFLTTLKTKKFHKNQMAQKL